MITFIPHATVLALLEEATRDHDCKRDIVEWKCDCGCGFTLFFRRTASGLASTADAFPPGTDPHILLIQNREALADYLVVYKSLARGESIERRDRLAEFIWSLWDDN